MSVEIEMPSQAALSGIKNLFFNYLCLTQQDVLITCFWHECRQAAAWILCELQEFGITSLSYSYAHREETRFSTDLTKLVEQARKKTKNRVIILVCEEETLAFSPFLRALNKESKVEVWRMMNTSAHLFEQSFASKREDLRYVNAWLLSSLMHNPHTKLSIRNKYGTELDVVLNNNKYQWISACGFPKAGELIILPTGEINTFPEKISGVFVAFGAIHANIKLPFDTTLENKRVRLEIDNGVLKHFSCQDKYLSRFLTRVFERSHMTTVGEFGIGTNIGITDFVSNNSHINERFPGVHLGLGMHLQPGDIVKYQTNVHMDFISPHGLIYIDGTEEPIYLDSLKPIKTEHPDNLSSEDGE